MPFNRPIPESKPQPKSSAGIQTLVKAEKLTQIAVLLPATAVIGWLAGSWLDSKMHQSWIGLAGMVLGGILGLAYVIRLAIATMNESGNGNGTGTGTEKGNPDPKP
jgi:hypothetical protein